ncbi:MAG: response regulator [Fuerstiella sp.]
MYDRPTLFLVDDDAALLDSLCTLAQTLGLRSETYSRADEFLAGFRNDRHGCLIVDIRMPGMSGLELQAQMVAAGHSLPTIVITGHGDISMSVRAMKAGAITFLEKPFETDDLVVAIRQALAEDVERRREHEMHAALERRMNQLTEDEREVLIFLARGRTIEAIAKAMDLSLRTIQFRRASIWKKLGVASRYEMMELLFKDRLRLPQTG